MGKVRFLNSDALSTDSTSMNKAHQHIKDYLVKALLDGIPTCSVASSAGLDVVRNILDTHLGDFREFGEAVLRIDAT